VGIYARTSSLNQKDNLSIEGQIDQCRRYCEQRDWVVSHIFVDQCLTAKFIDNRPKLQLLLEKAKSRELDIVVVWKIDRLCRSLADLLNVQKMLGSSKVELCAVTQQIDTTSSVGRFNFRSLASVAELESELIGERSRLGMHVLATQRRWPNNHPPLGYRINAEGRLQVLYREARVVKKIFEDYAKTRSMPELAYLLNAKGIPSKRRNKGTWTARAIQDVLTNRIYIGEFSVAGFQDNMECLRIIEDTLFKTAQKIMTRYQIGNAKRPRMPPDRKGIKLDKISTRYQEFLGSLA